MFKQLGYLRSRVNLYVMKGLETDRKWEFERVLIPMSGPCERMIFSVAFFIIRLASFDILSP